MDATPDAATVAGPAAIAGVVGWDHLEAVLLAALATEAPVLLVGPHGTAKSMLVERLAAALALPFRHYNAALVDYDDLVGIPLPDPAGDGLRFVSTPASVWGAGFVFLDELSRCRPHLQNKLFPLIHERRVGGVAVDGLRHRWAAMNPPGDADGDGGWDGAGAAPGRYLGAEPLDDALADRFPFVVVVPGWDELGPDDRHRLARGAVPPAPAGALPPAPAFAGPGVPVTAAAERCRLAAAQVEAAAGDALAAWAVTVVGHLGAAGLPQSPRRARMLVASAAAVHAARLVLEGPGADLGDSAGLALECGLPQRARGPLPSPAAVPAAHKQAWETTRLAADDGWREVLAEPDPLGRVAAGARLGFDDPALSRLVTRALAAAPTPARRLSIATASFLAFRHRNLDPAAFEPLARLAAPVIAPGHHVESLQAGRRVDAWREIGAHLATLGRGRAAELERGFLLAGFPDLWVDEDWRAALGRFQADLAVLGVANGDGPR